MFEMRKAKVRTCQCALVPWTVKFTICLSVRNLTAAEAWSSIGNFLHLPISVWMRPVFRTCVTHLREYCFSEGIFALNCSMFFSASWIDMERISASFSFPEETNCSVTCEKDFVIKTTTKEIKIKSIFYQLHTRSRIWLALSYFVRHWWCLLFLLIACWKWLDTNEE